MESFLSSWWTTSYQAFQAVVETYYIKSVIRIVMKVLSGSSQIERILDHPTSASTSQASIIINDAVYMRKYLMESYSLAQECASLGLPTTTSTSTSTSTSTATATATTTRVIETSSSSSSPSGREIITTPDLARSIVMKKGIRSRMAIFRLNRAIDELQSIKQTIEELRTLTKTPFSHENIENEKDLMVLWKVLMVEEEEDDDDDKDKDNKEIKSERLDFGLIGFQRSDPQTDFRGMGILGLHNLVQFCRNHRIFARRVLRQFCDQQAEPTRALPFAITAINVTGFLFKLCEERKLDIVFLYSLASQSENEQENGENNENANKSGIDTFQCIFDVFFAMLLHEWIESNPSSIMGFRDVMTNFSMKATEMLKQIEISLVVNNTVNEDLEVLVGLISRPALFEI
jgi:hypothetical protein